MSYLHLCLMGVVISTIHLQAAEEKQNGFPFRFDFRKGNSFTELVAVPKNTKMATNFGITLFNGKLFTLFSLVF